ncbi:MAG: hypothetical protein Q8O14_03425 [bacterium]|nr:hypothetical protein [bacterium]
MDILRAVSPEAAAASPSSTGSLMWTKLVRMAGSNMDENAIEGPSPTGCKRPG